MLRILRNALLLSLFSILQLATFAQYENHIWFMGNSTTGVQFDQVTNAPSPLNVQYTPWGQEGSGVVTNPITGELLFYSDGASVINSNHNLMPNGGGMIGNPSSAQAVAISPVPGECNKYYLFSNQTGSVQGANDLRYSLIDMTVPGGNVPAATKNLLLRDNVFEGMIVVATPGAPVYWLIGTLNTAGGFYVYKIDNSGVNLAGTYNFGSCTYTYNMSYSPVSGKVAVACTGAALAYTLNFDVNTGALSNYQSIANLTSVYDVEWSPDGTKLYYSNWDNMSLWQHDFNTGIQTNLYNSNTRGGGLRTGPDGKIYHITDWTSTFLSTINNPNAAGVACGFNLNAYNAGGVIGGLNLPEALTSSYFEVQPTTTAEDISCFAAGDGRAWVDVTGGTAPYTYEWSDGQTVDTAVGLAPGNYDVIVTDVFGCKNIDFFTITEPTELDIDASIVDSVSCAGDDDGTLTASASGGTPTYTIGWSLNPPQIGANVSNLTAGSYTAGVMDMNGCTDSITVNLTEPQPITLTLSKTDVTCFGGSDGTATVTANGGSGGFTYNWNSNPAQNSATATNLIAGNYSVTVTDQKGCTLDTSITLTENGSMSLSFIVTDVSCFGNADGAITAQPSGGTPNYTYNWDTNPPQNSATANGLLAGVYNVTVTDANGCTTNGDTTIVEPTQLVANIIDSTNVSCNAGNDGDATPSVSGGSLPYSYLWTGGNTDSIGTGFAAGIIFLTVTDNNGCALSDSVIISEPPLLTASISNSKDVSCNGGNDGEATATATGGTPNYTYQWSSGGNLDVEDGLVAGTYTVTVTDANGCIADTMITILEPTGVAFSVFGDTTICIGSNADIGLVSSGGTPPYTYVWSNNSNDSTQTVSPTVSTDYIVTVTDNENCPIQPDTVTIIVNPPLAVTTSPDTTICELESASISATGAGGDGNLTYTWDMNIGNGAGPFIVSPVVTTNYTVTVTDGCGTPPIDATVVVNVNPLPDMDFSVDPIEGCMPLEVEFDNLTTLPSGSIASYEWDFGDGGASSAQNPSYVYTQDGIYSVQLIANSAAGCVDSIAMPNLIKVRQLPTAQFSYSPLEAEVVNPRIDFEDESIDAVTWLWNFGDLNYSNLQNPSHEYPDSGYYYVTLIVNNQYECADTVSDFVRIAPSFLVYIPNAFTPARYGNALNDDFTEVGIGIVSRELRIFNRWGVQIFFTSELDKGWDGTNPATGELVEPGVYVYSLDVLSIENEYHTFRGRVTVLR